MTEGAPSKGFFWVCAHFEDAIDQRVFSLCVVSSQCQSTFQILLMPSSVQTVSPSLSSHLQTNWFTAHKSSSMALSLSLIRHSAPCWIGWMMINNVSESGEDTYVSSPALRRCMQRRVEMEEERREDTARQEKRGGENQRNDRRREETRKAKEKWRGERRSEGPEKRRGKQNGGEETADDTRKEERKWEGRTKQWRRQGRTSGKVTSKEKRWTERRTGEKGEGEESWNKETWNKEKGGEKKGESRVEDQKRCKNNNREEKSIKSGRCKNWRGEERRTERSKEAIRNNERAEEKIRQKRRKTTRRKKRKNRQVGEENKIEEKRS